MKLSKCILTIVLFQTIMYAGNSQPNSWFKHAGGTQADYGKALAVDHDGNTYLTGGFQSLSEFGEWRLSAEGDTDIFLAKYNALGELLWVRTAGSNSVSPKSISEAGTDILIANKYIYVTGIFSGTAKFDHVALQSFGSDDIFLAKYSLEGELQWVKNAGGSIQDIPYSLTNDNKGNIYLTGSFQKTATFGEQTVIATQGANMFFSKYNAAGEVQWVRQSPKINASGKVVACNSQHCWIAGENESNSFLEKYNHEGVLLWTKEFSGESMMSIEDIKILKNNLIVTGSFLGSFQFRDKTLVSKGGTDIYIGSLDKGGEFDWINSLGGEKFDTGKKIALSTNGQILLAGNFQSKIEMEDGDILNSGEDDIFLISFSQQGQINWSSNFGSDGQDQVYDIKIQNEAILMTGFFRSTVPVKNQYFQSKGLSDIFLSQTPLKPAKIFSEEEPVKSFNIYPNPAQENIHIYCKETVESVKIDNLLGQSVYEGSSFNSNRVKINIKALSSGTYLVKVFSGGVIREEKLIKD